MLTLAAVSILSRVRRVRRILQPPQPAAVKAQPKGPEPVAPPGTRTSSDFFDDYPRFYESNGIGRDRDRLNLRYEAIFAENADVFSGARVLDIASHDGRWSVAALANGAESVVGIEARQELVSQSEKNLAELGYAPNQYRFYAGDILDVMRDQKIDVDVVLCLGFLYHTLRYNELLHRIKQCNPKHLIIDTEAEGMRSRGHPSVVLRQEKTGWQGNAFPDEFSWGNSVVIGRPNLKAVTLMVNAYGFEVERLSDWGAILRDNPDAEHVHSYKTQKRLTLRCRRRDDAG